MTTIALLTKEEQLQYDYPPVMDTEERARCFAMTPQLEKKIKALRTTTNKVGFFLQYSYFKQCYRFFPINRLSTEDIEYVVSRLGLSLNDVDFSIYKNKTPRSHQIDICALYGYQPFLEKNALWLLAEVKRRVEQFINPTSLFFELLQLLQDNKIELPSYHRLSEMITQEYNRYEQQLIDIVTTKIEEKNKKIAKLLDELLEAEKTGSPGQLKQLKRINQSKKPKAIQASIILFEKVATLFNEISPVLKELSLTPHGIKYYATWVMKSKLSQLKQFPNRNKTYLYLMALIQFQYFSRQDAFIDILLKSVQTARNTTIILLKENDYLTRSERKAAVRYVTKKNKTYQQLVNDIQEAIKSPLLTDAGKIDKITDLLNQDENEKTSVDQNTLTAFEKSLNSIIHDKDYYDTLEKLSVKLQNKISNIVKILAFNTDNSDKILIDAINGYKQSDGAVNASSPNEFLSDKEKEALFDEKGKFRVSLYKILLFIYIADGIKSGALNLRHSYQYLSINDYLINQERWTKEKESLLALTGLTEFSNVDEVINKLKSLLNKQYDRVNTRFNADRNPYLSINDKGVVLVKTPAVEEKEREHISAFLTQTNYVPISSILSKINGITKFLKCFQHHSVKNKRANPKDNVFFAGIISLGCNIGVAKMAHISSGINQNTLQNTVNWYFSIENVKAANKMLIDLFNKLSLTRVFMTSEHDKHASSDGRKVNVSVPSLLANRSFKYFGKGSGVSIYTFIDERQVLFYSTVISASEREAAYVIDGLNNHDVIKIDIHSTDSHGFTESIFATTHFMNSSFSPRLKNIGKQVIYSFLSPETYKKKEYKILPSRAIDQNIIKQHWDDILRFMVTIKLKEITASQLFKRLSSYAKDHPLYKAIKEFGRIIKSLFILTYYDDLELRQRIEKQLNRIELSNKFGRAVFYDNSGEFKQGSPEEQKLITGCTVLIQNAIVLWNYLYLSQLIADCEDEKERQQIINMVRQGSVMHWAHVNLHGEFNFRRPSANEMDFNVQKILNLECV